MVNFNQNTQGIVNYKKQESGRKRKAILGALKGIVFGRIANYPSGDMQEN